MQFFLLLRSLPPAMLSVFPAHALLSPLDALLQPLPSVVTAAADWPDEAPLTLVEDSLACSADFLLLHALRAALAPTAVGNATAAVPASSSSVHSDAASSPLIPPSSATAAHSRGPAVVLCHFKQPAAHYVHIARKWGVSLQTHINAGTLYLCNDLSAPLLSASSSSSVTAASAASSSADFDRAFRTSSDAADAAPSALSSWVRALLSLRARHSSLLLLVDQWDWLALHATHTGAPEREAVDAIVTLQQRLAEMDEDRQRADAAAAAASASSASASLHRRSSLFLVSHGDVPVSPSHSLLRRHATSFVRLSGLSTGWTAEVTGVLSVQQQRRTDGFWTPPQRAHYKLTDTGVKLATPGNNTALLEQ
jgi:hypothetical protein